MKQVQLRLVADNTSRVVAAFARQEVSPRGALPSIDYRSAMRRVQQVLALCATVGLAPFRAVAWLVNVGAAVGLGFFRGVLKTVLAVFGFAVVAFVVYGVAHVLLWPMLHR